jgi:hypothetical protein
MYTSSEAKENRAKTVQRFGTNVALIDTNLTLASCGSRRLCFTSFCLTSRTRYKARSSAIGITSLKVTILVIQALTIMSFNELSLNESLV